MTKLKANRPEIDKLKEDKEHNLVHNGYMLLTFLSISLALAALYSVLQSFFVSKVFECLGIWKEKNNLIFQKRCSDFQEAFEIYVPIVDSVQNISSGKIIPLQPDAPIETINILPIAPEVIEPIKPIYFEYEYIENFAGCESEGKIFIEKTTEKFFKSYFRNHKCWRTYEDESFSLENQKTINTILSTQGPIILVFDQKERVDHSSELLKKVIPELQRMGARFEVFNFKRKSTFQAYEKEGDVSFKVVTYMGGSAISFIDSDDKVKDLINKNILKFECYAERKIPKNKIIDLYTTIKFSKINDNQYEITGVDNIGMDNYEVEFKVIGNDNLKFSSTESKTIDINKNDTIIWRIQFKGKRSEYTKAYKINQVIDY